VTGKRRPRPRIVLTVPELAAIGGLILYGFGVCGYTLFGAAFFIWSFVLAVASAPFAVAFVRRRRRHLARLRAARRRARVAAYSKQWLEWDEAA
jgi:hypothetical protein